MIEFASGPGIAHFAKQPVHVFDMKPVSYLELRRSRASILPKIFCHQKLLIFMMRFRSRGVPSVRAAGRCSARGSLFSLRFGSLECSALLERISLNSQGCFLHSQLMLQVLS